MPERPADWRFNFLRKEVKFSATAFPSGSLCVSKAKVEKLTVLLNELPQNVSTGLFFIGDLSP